MNDDYDGWQDKDEKIYVIDETFQMYHCTLKRECEDVKTFNLANEKLLK